MSEFCHLFYKLAWLVFFFNLLDGFILIPFLSVLLATELKKKQLLAFLKTKEFEAKYDSFEMLFFFTELKINLIRY